jgi:hypothetical protein
MRQTFTDLARNANANRNEYRKSVRGNTQTNQETLRRSIRVLRQPELTLPATETETTPGTERIHANQMTYQQLRRALQEARGSVRLPQGHSDMLFGSSSESNSKSSKTSKSYGSSSESEMSDDSFSDSD